MEGEEEGGGWKEGGEERREEIGRRSKVVSQALKVVQSIASQKQWATCVCVCMYKGITSLACIINTFLVQSNPPWSRMWPLSALLFLKTRPHSGHSTGCTGLGEERGGKGIAALLLQGSKTWSQ